MVDFLCNYLETKQGLLSWQVQRINRFLINLGGGGGGGGGGGEGINESIDFTTFTEGKKIHLGLHQNWE